MSLLVNFIFQGTSQRPSLKNETLPYKLRQKGNQKQESETDKQTGKIKQEET